MATPSYQTTCLYNKLIANDVYECAFTKPEGFTFTAGQFVLWHVPLVENPDDIQPRAYSIASSPDEEKLLFVIKLKEGGRASNWVSQVLTEGAEMEMKGPFGMFTLDEAHKEKDHVLVCTSTGVAPFRSQLLAATNAGFTGRFDLIFGVRNEEDLFWKEEFTKMTQDYEQVFVHFALSRPTESWTGHKGRVQTLAPLITKDFTGKRVYICGNPDMTTEVKQLCLEQWGILKEDLHVEGFI